MSEGLELITEGIKNLSDTDAIVRLDTFARERIATYPTEYTSVAEAKKNRAEINKGLKLVSDARKEYTRQYMEPVEGNIDRLKKLEKDMKAASDNIGTYVDAEADKERQDRFDVLKDYIFNILECHFIPAGRVINKCPGVLNKSTPIEEAKKLIRQKLHIIGLEYSNLSSYFAKYYYLMSFDYDTAALYDIGDYELSEIMKGFESWNECYESRLKTIEENGIRIDSEKESEKTELSASLADELIGGI